MSVFDRNTPPILPGPYVPPPRLPGYGGTPPINPNTNGRLPPWFPAPVRVPTPTIPGGDLPPTDEQVNRALAGAEYNPGPFCFGLDRYICEHIPRTIPIGPETGMLSSLRVELPTQGVCTALTNALCGILMTIILLVILGIAFYGLLQ